MTKKRELIPTSKFTQLYVGISHGSVSDASKRKVVKEMLLVCQLGAFDGNSILININQGMMHPADVVLLRVIHIS